MEFYALSVNFVGENFLRKAFLFSFFFSLAFLLFFLLALSPWPFNKSTAVFRCFVGLVGSRGCSRSWAGRSSQITDATFYIKRNPRHLYKEQNKIFVCFVVYRKHYAQYKHHTFLYNCIFYTSTFWTLKVPKVFKVEDHVNEISSQVMVELQFKW